MKNTIKLLGIIALAAVIGFSFAACNNSTNGDGGTTIGGTTVFQEGISVRFDSSVPTDERTGFNKLFTKYGNMETTGTLNSKISGSPNVEIQNGKLIMELGLVIPEGTDFIGATVVPSDVKFFQIGEFYTDDEQYFMTLLKNYGGAVWEAAALIYVDKNATMSGSIPTGEGWTLTFSGSLKTGWNYMLFTENENTKKATVKATQKLPSGYKWTVFKEDD